MAKSDKKFEEKLEELEKIVATLENGDVALDESIKKYTEAMELVKECDDELKVVEDKVNKIVSENGELKDFDESEVK